MKNDAYPAVKHVQEPHEESSRLGSVMVADGTPKLYDPHCGLINGSVDVPSSNPTGA